MGIFHLHGRTTGEDSFGVFNFWQKKYPLPLNKLKSIARDKS